MGLVVFESVDMFVPLAAVGFGTRNPLRRGWLGRWGWWFCGYGGGGRGNRRGCSRSLLLLPIAASFRGFAVDGRARFRVVGPSFTLGATIGGGFVFGGTAGDGEPGIGGIAVDGGAPPFSVTKFALNDVTCVRERSNLTRTVVPTSASLPASLASFGVNITGRRFTEPWGCPIMFRTVQ